MTGIKFVFFAYVIFIIIILITVFSTAIIGYSTGNWNDYQITTSTLFSSFINLCIITYLLSGYKWAEMGKKLEYNLPLNQEEQIILNSFITKNE